MPLAKGLLSGCVSFSRSSDENVIVLLLHEIIVINTNKMKETRRFMVLGLKQVKALHDLDEFFNNSLTRTKIFDWIRSSEFPHLG
jgi:hypothetical protein